MTTPLKLKREPGPDSVPVATADLRREYVAGGVWSPFWTNFFKTLPQYIDDITQDFGADLYERMLLDGQVASAFNLIKLAVLSQGFQLVNPKEQGDDKWDRAEEIRQFCVRALERLERPFEDTLFEILDAMAVGYKVAEKTFELATDEVDRGKLVYKSIKVKPRQTTAFLVDGFLNIKAVVGLSPKLGLTLQNALSIDPSTISLGTNAQLYNRDKFIIYTHRSKDNDPRGTSVLRPAYNAWWLKTQIWPEYLKYLAQFAGPSLIGYTAENANPTVARDSDLQVILDPVTGLPSQTTPEEVLLANLLAFRNGSALALPFGSKVEPLEMQGEGEAFANAINLFNQEITKAILYQTLATGEGQHQARAASETHQDVLDLIIRYEKLSVAHLIETDVLYQLVEYNYGADDAAELAPQVILPSSEIQDFPANAAAVGTLHSVGYFAPEQLPKVDAKLGLPERNMKDWNAEKDEERQLKLDQMKASIQKAEAPPGSENPKPARPKGGVAAGITDPDSRG